MKYAPCPDHEPVVDAVTGQATASCRCNPIHPYPRSLPRLGTEIERLTDENTRLRKALAGATACLDRLCQDRYDTRFEGRGEPGPCCYQHAREARDLLGDRSP